LSTVLRFAHFLPRNRPPRANAKFPSFARDLFGEPAPTGSEGCPKTIVLGYPFWCQKKISLWDHFWTPGRPNNRNLLAKGARGRLRPGPDFGTRFGAGGPVKLTTVLRFPHPDSTTWLEKGPGHGIPKKSAGDLKSIVLGFSKLCFSTSAPRAEVRLPRVARARPLGTQKITCVYESIDKTITFLRVMCGLQRHSR